MTFLLNLKAVYWIESESFNRESFNREHADNECLRWNKRRNSLDIVYRHFCHNVISIP